MQDCLCQTCFWLLINSCFVSMWGAKGKMTVVIGSRLAKVPFTWTLETNKMVWSSCWKIRSGETDHQKWWMDTWPWSFPMSSWRDEEKVPNLMTWFMCHILDSYFLVHLTNFSILWSIMVSAHQSVICTSCQLHPSVVVQSPSSCHWWYALPYLPVCASHGQFLR